jgi:hypothetical protein
MSHCVAQRTVHAAWCARQYGVRILMSEAFFAMLSPKVPHCIRLRALRSSARVHAHARAHARAHTRARPQVQRLCRLLDRVTVKGSVQPIRLYTYDVPLQHPLPGSTAQARRPFAYRPCPSAMLVGHVPVKDSRTRA